jgi:hypothetical protein
MVISKKTYAFFGLKAGRVSTSMDGTKSGLSFDILPSNILPKAFLFFASSIFFPV